MLLNVDCRFENKIFGKFSLKISDDALDHSKLKVVTNYTSSFSYNHFLIKYFIHFACFLRNYAHKKVEIV